MLRKKLKILKKRLKQSKIKHTATSCLTTWQCEKIQFLKLMYCHKSGIVLRKIEKSDLADLLKMKQESWWGTHKTSIINYDDQSRWYENIPSNQLFLIGEIDKPVGVAVYTGIDWINRCLNISGSVYKEHRSTCAYSGFCAGLDFAFEMLNMHRVEAEVLEYHLTAQKLEIDILGMKVEGRKRKSVYKCGKYYDSIMLGMLRSEWEQHPRVLQYGDSCNKNFSHKKFEKLMKRIK